jgi:ABC-type sugar transport system substrate-binding protein
MGVYAYDAAAEATAVEAAHRSGKTMIVGWDNQPGTAQLIQQNVEQATVFDNEQMYGQVATEILYDMHTFGVATTLQMFGFNPNGSTVNNVIDTPVVMVTKANLKSVTGF